MSRPTTARGSLGKISVAPTAAGTFEASARLRDELGKITRIRARATTAEGAEQALRDRAAARLQSDPHRILPGMTVEEAVAAWLAHTTARDTITQRTKYRYSLWGQHLVETCGTLIVRELDTPACGLIISRVLADAGSAQARQVKRTLSMVLGLAAKHGALLANPVRETDAVSKPQKIESALTGAGLRLVLDWLSVWRDDQRGGTKPDRQLLEDAIRIMAGTSIRPSEVLAIRRRDVEEHPGRVAIRGKIVEGEGKGKSAVRESYPKHERQARIIALPQFAKVAITRRLVDTGPKPDDLLFSTATGTPVSTSNFRRLMRSFREDHADAIRTELGFDPSEFTAKLYRRTAATVVDAEAGLDLAAGLLGHADTATTRVHYAVKDPEVNSRTADILDAVLDPDGPRDTPPPEPVAEVELPQNVIPFRRRTA